MSYIVPPVKLSPSRAVVDLLDGAQCRAPSVRLQRNVNLFRGLVRDAAPGSGTGGAVPDLAVFVFGSGGEPPRTNAGSPETCCISAAVTVWVRANRNAVADGEDLARFVWRQLHHNIPAPPYYDLECVEGEPAFIDLDNTEHPRWMILVVAKREE